MPLNHPLIVNDWFRSNGDKTYRLDYPLYEESIVFDIGAYRGNWTYDIYERYHCNIFLFEPVKIFYEGLLERFSKESKIKIFNYGMAGNCRYDNISVHDDASSVVWGTGINSSQIELKSFDAILNELRITNIDLIKINIEGLEYELLEDIIDKNLLNITKFYQIQFHNFMDSCETRRNKIRRALSENFLNSYDFDFVWEGWTRK
jgi:FkbM family methyltransferase